jgi:general stress protein 26
MVREHRLGAIGKSNRPVSRLPGDGIQMSETRARKLIWDHVKSIQTCMMVTRDTSDVRARPMRSMPRPEQNEIWFFADSENHSDEVLQRHPDVCLTYVDTRDNVYVSLSGRIARVVDQAAINEMWNEEAGSYFSKGPDDPRVILLRFEPHTGEYWTAPSGPIVLAIKFLEAAIMGERPTLGTTGRTPLP